MQLSDLREELEAKNGALRRYEEQEKIWQAEKEDLEFEHAQLQGGHTAALEDLQERENRRAKMKAPPVACQSLALHAHAGRRICLVGLRSASRKSEKRHATGKASYKNKFQRWRPRRMTITERYRPKCRHSQPQPSTHREP